MAEANNKSGSKAADESQQQGAKDAPQEKAEERFTLDELAEKSGELGASRVTFAGAAAYLRESGNKTHTLAQAKDALRKFLRGKVRA